MHGAGLTELLQLYLVEDDSPLYRDKILELLGAQSAECRDFCAKQAASEWPKTLWECETGPLLVDDAGGFQVFIQAGQSQHSARRLYRRSHQHRALEG